MQVMGKRSWGRVRQLPSGRWQAGMTGPDGNTYRARVTFETERRADEWLSAKRREVDRAEYIKADWLCPPDARMVGATKAIEVTNNQPVLFRDYAASWLKDRALQGSTRERYERLLARQINSILLHHRREGRAKADRKAYDEIIDGGLGDLPVKSLTDDIIEKWWRALPKSHPRSNQQAWALLSTVCKAAVRDKLLASNPCTVEGAGGNSRKATVTVLEPAEIWKLADAMTPQLRVAVLLAGWLGLRSGEIRALRKRDIDPRRGLLHVSRTITKDDVGNWVEKDGTKTDAGVRTIPIPKTMLLDLEVHLMTMAEAGSDGLLFHDGEGGWVHHEAFRVALIRACKAADLQYVTWHGLRHGALSYLELSGASDAEAMRLGGHTSMNMVGRYREAIDSHLAEVTSKLDAIVGSGLK